MIPKSDTLEADVYEILVQKKEIQPSAIRKRLEERSNYKNEDSRTLDVHIIRALNKLIEKGRVEEPEIDKERHSWYSITEQGLKDASFLIPFARIKGKEPQKVFEVLLPEILNPIIAQDYPQKISERRTISTLHDVTPEGKAPVDVAFYLDPGNKDKIEAASRMVSNDLFLRNTAFQLVAGCQRAILNAAKDVYHWDGYQSGPPQIQKMVERLKMSLDFDVILFLHFNGKRLVEEYDWNADLKKYEEHDRLEHETWSPFVSGVSEIGVARESWIEWCILEQLGRVNHDLEVFNNLMHLIGPDSASMLTQFAEHIVGIENTGKILHKGPKPPTVDDVKKHLEKMIAEGVVEFAVTLKVNSDKIGKRQRNATNIVFQKTGYVLP